MNLQKIWVPVAGAATVVLGYVYSGWPGVALIVGALVMWLLLHFNRMMQVLKRAANRPIGYIESAVMLNAKLKTGVNLMHVIALTRSLGELTTPKDQQPEVYRWRDNSQSVVTCVFQDGRLQSWALERPSGAEPTTDAASAALGGPTHGAP